MSEIPADILETTNKLVNHYVNPYEPRTDCRPDFRPYLRKLIAEALAAERQRDRWQPIETAPHEVNVLLAWADSTFPEQWKMEAGMASWGWRRDGISNMSEHGQATHWQPLPSPPKPHHFNQEGK